MRTVLAILVLLVMASVSWAQDPLWELPQRPDFGVNCPGVTFDDSNIGMADAMRNSSTWMVRGGSERWKEIDPHDWPTAYLEQGLYVVLLNQYHPAGEYLVRFGPAGPKIG